MKQSSTTFLRLTVLGMGLAVLGLCALVLPEIAMNWSKAFPYVAAFHYPVLIGLVATTVPFYLALFQALKLLGYIDKNNAFSDLSIRALNNIKFCAAIISAFYVIAMPLIYYVADTDDAPGLMVIGLVLAFAPMTIAVFAAVLQRVLQNAIDIKSENDLTV